jgi:hypothetical protein
VSCKTISVYNEDQNTTIQSVLIGTVGFDEDFILKRDYNKVAIPTYKNPIKVHASLIDFNKTVFKAFENAQKSQPVLMGLTYIDSVKTKPQYLKLEISDRLEVLNSLNNTSNKSLFELLKIKNDAHLVTTIAIAFNVKQLELISKAEEVFLESSGLKNYSLNLYANGEKQHIIQFNEGVIFAYQTSNCCWKQNDKYQLEIIDLVEGNDKCPNNSFRSSNRAKKKINYYKF